MRNSFYFLTVLKSVLHSSSFVALFTFLFSTFSFADAKDVNKITLVSAEGYEPVIQLEINQYKLQPVVTDKGKVFVIQSDNGTPILSAGDPDLTKYTTSVIIPDRANMEVEIVASSYTDYNNVMLAPSKGNLSRQINPSTVPYSYSNTYNKDEFFPGELAALRTPFIIQNKRGQTVILYPFQYNPVQKIVRVYNSITIKLKVRDEINPANPNRQSIVERGSAEFGRIFQNHFLNYESLNEREYTPVEEQGKMLIIAYGNFMTAMQPFIDWKRQKGMDVRMVNVSTVGANASSIKTYVQNYYDTTNLVYLLLVGDAPQIPTYISTNGPSDNTYSYVSGMDSYPDLFSGRFSASTVAEVQTQVQRVIDYEKTPTAGALWHKKGLGYASDQGPGDDNEMDFEHIRNIRAKLLIYTYNAVAELYDGSQGGADAPGNPSNFDVFDEIQSGVGIINYTGHGSCTSSGTSGFSTSDIANLTNVGMLPFFISVACVNGEFTNATEICMAEKFLRATYNGQPAGAIATLMSTINQSWSPPMEGQDAINDILTESNASNIKRTFGGITMNGCMKMNDVYGLAGVEMTDTWTIFGDPSLEIRTDAPALMTVDHADSVLVGVDQLTVNCTTDDALVALTMGGEIIGSEYANAGSATINFPAITAPGTITVTVTGYNKVPYIGTVDVKNPVVSAIKEAAKNNEVRLMPNPASKATDLKYSLDEPSKVSYIVYDAIGKPVLTNYNMEIQTAGTYETRIDLSSLIPGVYFLKFNAGRLSAMKRLVIIE